MKKLYNKNNKETDKLGQRTLFMWKIATEI